jgi:hypothetical protein
MVKCREQFANLSVASAGFLVAQSTGRAPGLAATCHVGGLATRGPQVRELFCR